MNSAPSGTSTALKSSANNSGNSYRWTICASDRRSLENVSRWSFVHQRWRRSWTRQTTLGALALALKLTSADNTGEPLCRAANKSDERCECTTRLTFPLWTQTKTGGRKMSCTSTGSRVELIRYRRGLTEISRNYWGNVNPLRIKSLLVL